MNGGPAGSRNSGPAGGTAVGMNGSLANDRNCGRAVGRIPRSAGGGNRGSAGCRAGAFLAALGLVAALALALPQVAAAVPFVQEFGPYTLTQERLGPGLWYFQIFEQAPEKHSSPPKSILISPMLKDPQRLVSKEQTEPFPVTTFEGRPELRIYRESDNMRTVFTVSPYSPDGRLAGVVFHREGYTFAAGLGAQLNPLAEGMNLLGKTVMPTGPHGPRLQASEFGALGSLQIPVCYFLGDGTETAAFFMNETRPLVWDFSASPWTVSLAGPLNPDRSLSFFVITGEDLPAVRRAFMGLVGRPPLPPRSIFAPWIVDTRGEPASSASVVIRGWKTRFPLLPMIGGLFRQSPSLLPYDDAAKANTPLMAPETPYVPVSSPFYEDMRRRGFLVREYRSEGRPAIVDFEGQPSALVDYTDPGAATYWHSLSRTASYGKGARIFFFAGGEPETASPLSWYRGVSDPETHSQYAWANRYSLKWMEGFVLGARQYPQFLSNMPMRNFMMVRAGMGGMGRHGAGVYAADPSLIAPASPGQARSQSALSGIDYYTTDVTQYLARWSPSGPWRSMYESWGARNILLNLPLLLPDVLIDEPWAKQLIEFKSELEPYHYSLAHLSTRLGDPLTAPLLYAFQGDPGTRVRATEFMMGPWILVGAGSGAPGDDPETARVYVPAGRWFDYFAGEVLDQAEGSEISRPGKVSGYLMPPILLREGAIVPTRIPSRPDTEELGVKIFPGPAETTFTLYEDDGQSEAWIYRQEVMTTDLELRTLPGAEGRPEFHFTVKARKGHAAGAVPKRRFVLEFMGIGNPGTATLDGWPYDRSNRLELLEQQEGAAWAFRGTGNLVFRTSVLDLTKDHTVVIH
jgi:alpha-glucosidase